jgi:hypothetical protein
MLLRNDLIAMLSQHDNNPITADVNGIMIDVEEVTVDRDSIVLILNQEDVTSVLRLARGPLAAPPRRNIRVLTRPLSSGAP